MWQTYKSDASKAGIDINLVGQTFNTIVGEAAPCAPMGPKCNVQVFAYGGWVFDGPGFEPTGEPLFATGAGSNAGNYSDPKMDNLINATHTSSSLDVFHSYATYGAQQLPFIWNPNAVHDPGGQQQAARCHVRPAVQPVPRVLGLHQVVAFRPRSRLTAGPRGLGWPYPGRPQPAWRSTPSLSRAWTPHTSLATWVIRRSTVGLATARAAALLRP